MAAPDSRPSDSSTTGALNADQTTNTASEDKAPLSESRPSSPHPKEAAKLSEGEPQDEQSDETQSAAPSDRRASPVARAPGLGGPNISFKDALRYIDQVKAQFSPERTDTYQTFLDILSDFKNERIDTPGVIERVSTIFHGHPSLIEGFNAFVPDRYRTAIAYQPVEQGEDLVIHLSKL